MSAIVVKGLSKHFDIEFTRGSHSYRKSIQADVVSAINQFISFAKGPKKEVLWALKDIDFTVEKGESLAIIGRNGSGKSTLLKILAGISLPTKGSVHIEGRVGTLLKIGLGFHPELTGRENIFLGGTILGISIKEIKKELTNIIAFSGIGKLIDSPVKYYSSGMYVRLAFSIATLAVKHPDVLLIDEILAVGDQEFQLKCMERMQELVKSKTTTLVLVSHNIWAIQNLCTRCIWLEDGKIRMIGDTNRVIEQYQKEFL